MKIELTKFAERHFDKKFTGTKILNMSKENFIDSAEEHINWYPRDKQEGYAPFCKLFTMNNITDAKTGTLPLTIENYHYLRSGYSARNETELPVLSRWLDIPRMFIPKAKFLVIVLYTREQLLKEHKANGKGKFELDEKTDYGIVAILGQMNSDIEPMTPMTMMRNSMGKEYGGSGVELDITAYEESIDFWKNNVTVK